jgi:DNA-binding transcriptional LysR family regulator
VAVPARRPQLEVVPRSRRAGRRRPRPSHRASRPLLLAALDGQPFIGFDRDIPTRRMVDAILRRHGVRVRYVMELDNVETIKRSVEAGLGVSLLPAPTLAAEVRARTLVGRPPVEGPFHRPIGLLYRRGRELSAASPHLPDPPHLHLPQAVDRAHLLLAPSSGRST